MKPLHVISLTMTLALAAAATATAPATQHAVFLGSALPLRDAIAQANTVGVAEFLDIGVISPDAGGISIYDGMRIKVTRLLHVSAPNPTGVLPGPPPQTITVRAQRVFTPTTQEAAPQKGDTAIFFLAKDLQTLKLLPADVGSLALVENALRPATARDALAAAATTPAPDRSTPAKSLAVMIDAAPGVATSAPAFTWGKEVDGLRLGISIAHAKVGGTQPVIVSMRLENGGKTARDLVFSGPLKGFQCEVSHAETKSQLTEYGKVFNPEPVVMSEPQRLRLEPGQQLNLDICCSRICDMTISDKYSITISRRIPSADGKSWIKVESAPIEVEVADE